MFKFFVIRRNNKKEPVCRYSLERGDLAQAVQFMGLLKGEPRRVAGDWLAEARLHLEAKQAAAALLAHAAARGAEVLPRP
jgi:mitofilin